MKKLTIKSLKNELNETSFFLGNYKGIVKDKNNFYVIYPFTTVKYSYSPVYQWTVSIYGECLYALAKHSVKLCDKLEEKGFIGDVCDD